MIVGNGDIARVLPDREGFTFFASGVSNSRETDEREYWREMELLYEQDDSTHLVYFGSLCVFYSNTRYARHKRYMEGLVKKVFKHWTILRLGNISWGNNPNTLINYLRMRKELGLTLEIQDTYRYVVEQEELLHWIGMIPEWNCEMNIPGRRMKVREIVDEFVEEKVGVRELGLSSTTGIRELG